MVEEPHGTLIEKQSQELDKQDSIIEDVRETLNRIKRNTILTNEQLDSQHGAVHQISKETAEAGAQMRQAERQMRRLK